MEVTLIRSRELPPGTALLPPGLPGSDAATLRLGTVSVQANSAPGAREGHLVLAPDLWHRLAVPLEGMRFELHRNGSGEAELGPAVAVLFAGRAEELSHPRACYRAGLSFGHRLGAPGLFALGFDHSIEWESGAMNGYVVDTRPGSAGSIVPARFPIPSAVRLSWSVRPEVVEQLKETTRNRTFNWVRGLDKYRFHTLVSAKDDLREHLPDTRVMAGPADLAAMLTRYDTIFVKNVTGSRGKAIARVCQTENGFEVSHIDGGKMVRSTVQDIDGLMARLRPALGRGRRIAQQGVNTVGNLGRAAHFRIVLVKDGRGRWHCPVTEALAAPNVNLAITNQANGAESLPVAQCLEEHHGLSPLVALQCEQEMIQLSLRVAAVLETPLDPLGILGVDLGRDVKSGKLWLFEANTVPGWGYPDEVEHRIAQSLTDYALFLTGWNDRLLK